MANQILSGIQQSVYASFAEAKADAYKGKLLFARVTGGTDGSYGYDANGKLISGGTGNQGKTYVFFGNKVYGSFPQLPIELLRTLGISVDEANTGSITSLTEYFTSHTITEILKELKAGAVTSTGKTILVTTNTDGKTNVEANIDNDTIVKDANGVLSVDQNALSAVTEVVVNTPSSTVVSSEKTVIDGTDNVKYTIGLKGGADSQVIKKSGDSYVWAYESSTDINSGAVSGVNVTYTIDETGAKTYSINGDFKVSANTAGVGSAAVTTYKLMVKNGADYVQAGDEIKLLNDNYLKSVATGESGTAKGIIFTFNVKTQAGGDVTTAQTFVPFTDLNTYFGGSGITINETDNTVNVKLGTGATNILGFDAESGLVATAVKEVYVNGTKLTGAGNTVSASSLVSSVTTTYNGAENKNVISGAVSEGGVMNIDLHLSADTVPFDNTNTKAINPALSGENVQTIIEEIASATQASTSGVLTVEVNGTKYGEYNPSASTTVNLPQLSALTIGAENFTFGESGLSAHIDSINASAVTYEYNGQGNTDSAFTGTTKPRTVSGNLELIIDKLNDATVTGIDAISAEVTTSGTNVSLTLNESNTTSQAGGIISSEEGAVATGTTLASDKATNAVKMSQDKDNGLFVYIEIAGDDVDDINTPTAQNAMFYTAGDNAENALGVQAELVTD